METIRTRVCVVGGGPAGVMLGLLLARARIDVVVLEKHDEFFRDFRGDTVHPSTLNIIDALGLCAGFDAIALEPAAHGVPIDVLWFRLPAPGEQMPDTLAWVTAGTMLITIPRPGYIQCGMIVAKGSFDGVRDAGIDAFRDRVACVAPRLQTVVHTLASFDDVKLLCVQLNHLPEWWVPGALLIGDAAHAMSPAFGVGINYAIQDAVPAARLLIPVLRGGADPAAIDRACAALQRRRSGPTLLMQRIQRLVHRAINRRPRRILHDPPTRANGGCCGSCCRSRAGSCAPHRGPASGRSGSTSDRPPLRRCSRCGSG